MASLSDFHGKTANLTYVNFDTLGSGSYEANRVMFILDQIHYTVMEDPEDGYRSHMQSDIREEYLPYAPSTSFPPCRVHCVHCHTSSDDYLQLIDAATAQVVLEIGTKNTDDYYPYFIAHYHPENMSQNAEVLENDPDKDKYWHEREFI